MLHHHAFIAYCVNTEACNHILIFLRHLFLALNSAVNCFHINTGGRCDFASFRFIFKTQCITLITATRKNMTHVCRSIIITSSWDKIIKILTCMSVQRKLKDSKIITENQ